MTRSKSSRRFAGAAIFLAALMMFGIGGATKAHADDFASGNAALLDPFDPVPQIRFSDCYDDCGHRRCDDGCGYRRHCWHGCGDYGRWRDGWRCDHECRDTEHGDWRCEHDCGPRPWDLNREWADRLREYDHQLDKWQGAMHEWHDAMGEWREENGHWFFRHRDDHDGDHHGDHHDGDHDGHDDGHHDDGHHDDHH